MSYSKGCDLNNNDSIKIDEGINPFINDVLEHLTLRQKIQLAICSVTVAPVRAFFLVLSFAVLWPVSSLLARGRTEEETRLPLTGWRKFFLPVARFFSRCVFASAAYHWIKITGERDPDAPILIFAPHSGFFDSMLITYLNFVSVIGRKGTEEILLFGNLTKLCQPIIVDRESEESRKNTINQIVDRVKSPLDWPPLSIFAEGTCTNKRCLIKFKTGAFRPGVPVQPVCFKYNKEIMDTSSWTWDGPHWFVISWMALCQIYSPVEFEFLPIYRPSEAEKKDPELFAENVRQVMSKSLDIPMSDYSYEDAKVSYKVKGHGLPSGAGLINIHKMIKITGVSSQEINSIIPCYAQIADRKSGLCYLDKFASNLGLVVNDNVIRLFEIFDKEKSGNFTLKVFVEAYFTLIHKINKDEALENVLMSFDKFKTPSSHYAIDEFQTVVKKIYKIEFENLHRMNSNEEKTIDKEMLRDYLNKNILILYLFAVVAKEQ